jgi:hypothetical protein
MRFNRLGAWCDPNGSAGSCPNIGTGANFVYNVTNGNAAYPGGSVICFTQAGTGLNRNITVLQGGRVAVQP